MSRTFTTKGRANPWQTPAPRHFTREGRTGPLLPMDREPISKGVWLGLLAVASPFLAAALSWAGQ